MKEIIKREGVEEKELRAATRKPKAVRARRIFCQLAVKKLKYYGSDVARYLGMTTSAVNRSANTNELTEIKNYL
jgi:hypothetical protein